MTEIRCLASSIKVAAGHYVDLANPDPKTIDIKSIASALSKICRFGGHCPEFYSVAEHSVGAVSIGKLEGLSNDVLIAVLLHDAAEAYVGDMVRPLKASMPQYRDAEQRVTAAIEQTFGVDFSRHHETIKRLDNAMLKAEKLFMWPDDEAEWFGFKDIKDYDVAFEMFPPWAAEDQFLFTAAYLGISV